MNGLPRSNPNIPERSVLPNNEQNQAEEANWPYTDLALSPQQFEDVRSTVVVDGQISSDGEFSAIASREVKRLEDGGFDLMSVKEEDDVVAAPLANGFQAATSPVVYNTPSPQEACAGPVISNAATGFSPSTQNWPGELGFDVRVPAPVKSKDAQFSEKLCKMYINQNRVVNLYFKIRPPPANVVLYIRAVVIYTSPDHFQHPVKVCFSHSRKSDGSLRKPHSDHLMISEFYGSTYHEDPVSGRHSVMSAVPATQPGCDEVVVGYKFTDLGSCPGGLNRRDTAIIFTLEYAGNIIGRKVLPLRICTCPKRDLDSEEQQAKKSIVSANLLAGGGAKVKKEKRQAFWVLAYGEDNFEALQKVGEVLEKKDSGADLTKYRELVEKFNDLKTPGCKRQKLN